MIVLTFLAAVVVGFLLRNFFVFIYEAIEEHFERKNRMKKLKRK